MALYLLVVLIQLTYRQFVARRAVRGLFEKADQIPNLTSSTATAQSPRRSRARSYEGATFGAEYSSSGRSTSVQHSVTGLTDRNTQFNRGERDPWSRKKRGDSPVMDPGFQSAGSRPTTRMGRVWQNQNDETAPMTNPEYFW